MDNPLEDIAVTTFGLKAGRDLVKLGYMEEVIDEGQIKFRLTDEGVKWFKRQRALGNVGPRPEPKPKKVRKRKAKKGLPDRQHREA